MGKEETEGFVTGLLDDRFGLLHLVDEKESVAGVTFWVKYGKIVFDSSCCEHLLAPAEAERLGLRLIELSRVLGRGEDS